MEIYLLKFIHVVIAVSLLGLSFYGIALTASNKYITAHVNHKNKVLQLNKIMLLIASLALLTGTLLVIPKNFTFHTPWIQAAYLFCLLFISGILLLILMKKKIAAPKRVVLIGMYGVLAVILILLIHDAITKATFIF